MAIFRCRAFCTVRSFYDVINNTFLLQYISLSLPSYSIRDGKTLVINKKTAFAEVLITNLIMFSHFGILFLMPDFKLKLNVLHILFWMINFSSIFFSLVTAYEMKAKIYTMKSIFEKIKTLDGIIILERKQLRSLTIKLRFWIAAVLFTVVITVTETALRSHNILMKTFIVISTLRIYAQPVVILMQFFSLITLVSCYLEWVDKQLIKLRLLNENEKGDCGLFTLSRSHFREIEDCKTACKIEKIRKVYGCVNDLKREVNDMYSLRLWSDTVNTILQILFFIYTCLLIVQQNDGLLQGDLNISFHYLMFWITALMLKFCQNVSICGRVAECGKTIGTTVHQMVSRSYCESVRQELTSFSLELLHRDPYIKAYKFFDIDYPLTAGVVRGILMQLIALMQLNLPEFSDTDDILQFMSPPKKEEEPSYFPGTGDSSKQTNLTLNK